MREHGAALAREGGRHSIWRREGAIASVPRHREIKPAVARKICSLLGIPGPPGR